MTNKERQAKLQYLLNSLSMTKEQKDIVVDLVNSSGNGGGSGEDNIVEIFADELNNVTVKLGDIEYSAQGKIAENGNMIIKSNNIYNLLSDNIYKDAIVYINFESASDSIVIMSNIITKYIDTKMICYSFIYVESVTMIEFTSE